MRTWTLLLPALIAGCAQRSDDRICDSYSDSPKVALPAKSVLDANYVMAQCIHRWSFRLAGATGTMTEVSRAVVQACHDPIAAVESFQISAWREAGGVGVPPSAIEAPEKSATDLAMFYIAMSRAGNCNIP